MAWTLEFKPSAERDLGGILDHLFRAYRDFGETTESAFDSADARVAQIRQEARRLIVGPYRGDRHEEILPGLRHLTMGRAVYWFEVDGATKRVTVPAIFFGAQDYHRKMISRLTTGD